MTAERAGAARWRTAALPVRLVIILVLLAGAARASAAKAPSAGEILARAARASHRVAYEGTRVVILWLADRSEAIECQEHSDGRGRARIRYLAPPSAKGREVIDDGRYCWQVEPGARQVYRKPSVPLPSDVERWDPRRLAGNYRVALRPALEVVAGRRAYRIDLVPRHRGKASNSLWVDTQTYLVLRREARHADGSPARTEYFSAIRLNVRPSPALFRFVGRKGMRITGAGAAARPLDLAAARRFLGVPLVLPRRVPSLGFELRSAFGKKQGAERSLHLLYEDGIATLSVFVDRKTREARMNGARRVSLGGRPALIRLDGHFAALRWVDRGLRYTVVGDLTSDALLSAGRDLCGLPQR